MATIHRPAPTEVPRVVDSTRPPGRPNVGLWVRPFSLAVSRPSLPGPDGGPQLRHPSALRNRARRWASNRAYHVVLFYIACYQACCAPTSKELGYGPGYHAAFRSWPDVPSAHALNLVLTWRTGGDSITVWGKVHASPTRGAGTATGFKGMDKAMGQGLTKFLTDSERHAFRLLTGPRVDHLSRTDARDLGHV